MRDEPAASPVRKGPPNLRQRNHAEYELRHSLQGAKTSRRDFRHRLFGMHLGLYA